ncbi:MAG: GNAT family N-acetyltransferase [Candidatus Bruticola sp.]
MSLFFDSLETERLKLVPQSHDYCDDIFREFTAEVARYMIPQPNSNKDYTVQFIEDCIKAHQLASDLEVVILDKNSGAFLGCLGVLGLNKKTPSLGLWLKKSAWRQGYACESVQAVLNWLKNYRSYRYVIYPVDRDNTASRHVAEKCGGVLDNVYAEKNMTGQVLNVCEYHINL